jgi:hypothetical protein
MRYQNTRLLIARVIDNIFFKTTWVPEFPGSNFAGMIKAEVLAFQTIDNIKTVKV